MRIGNYTNISFVDVVILYNIDLYNDTDKFISRNKE
ncbi:hypothetical protein ABH942_002743 [Flavobacterium sp. 28YEA47A]